MSRYVFALSSSVVWQNGMDVQLVEGRAYAADDSVVQENPHLFSDTPTVYTSRNVVVEQATAAPGERRAVRRHAR